MLSYSCDKCAGELSGIICDPRVTERDLTWEDKEEITELRSKEEQELTGRSAVVVREQGVTGLVS